MSTSNFACNRAAKREAANGALEQDIGRRKEMGRNRENFRQRTGS